MLANGTRPAFARWAHYSQTIPAVLWSSAGSGRGWVLADLHLGWELKTFAFHLAETLVTLYEPNLKLAKENVDEKDVAAERENHHTAVLRNRSDSAEFRFSKGNFFSSCVLIRREGLNTHFWAGWESLRLVTDGFSGRKGRENTTHTHHGSSSAWKE